MKMKTCGCFIWLQQPLENYLSIQQKNYIEVFSISLLYSQVRYLWKLQLKTTYNFSKNISTIWYFYL